MVKRGKKDLTSGNLFKTYMLFGLPIIATNLLQLFFNAADIAVVGIFASDLEVAAVGSNSSLISLIIGLFVGLSIGANVHVAHLIGEREYERAKNSVGTAIIISLISGCLMGVVGFFVARTFLVLMGCAPTVIDLATKYLQVYFLGMPLIMLYNFCSAILRAVGDSVRPLIFIAVGGVLNVALNVFFVAVVKLTVEGVAIATVVSNGFAAILSLIVLIKNKNGLRVGRANFRIYKKELFHIFRIGIPSGIQSSVFSLSNVVMQSGINSFGDVVMASNSVATQFDNIIHHVGDGFAIATLSFISQNYGKGDFKRVKKMLLLSSLVIMASTILLSLIIVLLAKPLCGIMTDSPQVIEAAVLRIKIMGLTYWLCGLMSNYGNSLKGFDKPVTAMIISLIGACLFRVLWVIFILPLNKTLVMLYVIWPITWVLTAVTLLIFTLIAYKKAKKRNDLLQTQN